MKRSVVTLGLDEREEPPTPASGGDADDPIFKTVQMPPRQPGGLAASTLLHVLIIALVVQAAIVHAPAPPPKSIALQPRADAVFLPRPAEVRRMLGLRPLPPKPAPTPAPNAKDRISIGPPSSVRPEKLILHRDDDLTKVAKGIETPADTPAVAAAPTPPPSRPIGTSVGEGGRLVAPAPVNIGVPGPIQASLRRLQATGGDVGPLGVRSGVGGQMGPLFFDPQGADFTVWVQHWKNEVYRNWILPPAAEFGVSGQSDLEFVVDRAGTVTEVRLVHSSGVAALDRAARNALAAARLLPLPADYAPATLTIQVSMSVNARPAPGDGNGQ